MAEIKFVELSCFRCGGLLKLINDNTYQCAACGKMFEKQVVTDVVDQLRAVLNEQKQEAVANFRRQLWAEMHETYINSEKIVDLARDLKKYLPEDYFANFCEVANDGSDRQINEFLNNTPKEAMSDYADIVLDFMLKSVTASNLNSISLFIERAFKGDTQNYDKYVTRYEQEAQKVNSGIYELILTRDVFLAYSSADIEKVLELCDYLESNGITCFLALRNLRHGRGAVDNYDRALQTAIDNCKTVVFVSSTNSRSLSCDALTRELPYIRQKELNAAPVKYRHDYSKLPSEYMMPRIEYLIESYTGNVAEMVTKEFFHSLEWCTSKEAVAERLLNYLVHTPVPEPAPKPKKEKAPKVKAQPAEPVETPVDTPAPEVKVGFFASLRERKLQREQERKRKEEEERKRREAEEAKNPLFKLGNYRDIGGGYITFGTYPQSKKADNVTIVKIFDTKRWYYLGSDNSLYAEWNGEYYKVEPIKWKVLSQGSEWFIVSDIILDAHRFDGSSNNYANSKIRKWLNGEFYKKAFTEAQRNLILTTNVDNNVSSTAYSPNQYICDNTNDKIFLLSYKEADQYLNSNEARKRVPTEYAVARGAYQDNDNYSKYYMRDGKGCGRWWLRSPYYANSDIAQHVSRGGDADHTSGVYGNYGVVCALWFKP